MVGWVGSQVEWCIVGVVVGVWVELEVLGLMVGEGSVSVPPPSWPGRQAPPLPRTTLVTSALTLLAAVGGAVQRVSAGAVLVEASTLVALLPGAMRAGRAHARGRSLKGKRQESWRRWWK